MKPYHKNWKKRCKDGAERRKGLETLAQAEKNMVKLLSKTAWEPAETKFNLDFLKNELEGLEGAEEVLD